MSRLTSSKIAKVEFQLSAEQTDRLITFLAQECHTSSAFLEYQSDCLLCQTAEILTKAINKATGRTD